MVATVVLVTLCVVTFADINCLCVVTFADIVCVLLHLLT